MPAALANPRLAFEVARGMAALQGCERATLGASTLHLFWDLFAVLGRGEIALFVDSGAYSTGRWGAERAAARGVPVRMFEHHDPGSLTKCLQASRHGGRRPVIVADGFCPGCGK